MRQKKLRFERMLQVDRPLVKNYRAKNIKEVNPTYEGPVVAIDLFYMTAAKVVRRSSSYAGAPAGSHVGWTVMRLDAEGNKYGEAEHTCHKYVAVDRANRIAQDTHLLNSERIRT